MVSAISLLTPPIPFSGALLPLSTTITICLSDVYWVEKRVGQNWILYVNGKAPQTLFASAKLCAASQVSPITAHPPFPGHLNPFLNHSCNLVTIFLQLIQMSISKNSHTRHLDMLHPLTPPASKLESAIIEHGMTACLPCINQYWTQLQTKQLALRLFL
jgi:hypothetical protein